MLSFRMRWRLPAAMLLGALGATAALPAMPAGAEPVQTPSADTEGCGFGEGGPNASTICWLDMSGFDAAQAASPAGQPMTVQLTSGYSMSFLVRHERTFLAGEMRPVTAAPFPTWSGTPIGNVAYQNTPGQPAIYEQTSGSALSKGGEITLSDITVLGPGGATLDGYGFVMADAESTNAGERLVFKADNPLSLLTTAAQDDSLPACGGAPTGIGTTTVTCLGTSGNVGSIVTSVLAPTTVSVEMHNNGHASRQGIAFGVLVGRIGLNKTVAGRVGASDDFELAITDAAGNTVASAATGGADSASTGNVVVLPGQPSSTFTLTESGAAGTDLAAYSQSWSCTNRSHVDVPELAIGEGPSQTVALAVGDDVECTVTNTAPEAPTGVDLVLTKGSEKDQFRPGQSVPFTFTVTNQGPGVATDVVVADELPSTLTFVSSSTCTEVDDTVVCQIGSLAPGESATVSLVARTSRDFTGSAIQNSATVTAAEEDLNPSDNTSTTRFTCAPTSTEGTH